MNIAIIVSCLYSGGAERIAGYLSKKISKIHNVYLFLEYTDKIVYDYGGQIVNVGVEGDAYTEYYVEQYKSKYNIDYAISFLERYNLMNIRTRQKEKVIVSVRCMVNKEEYYHEYVIREYYKYADSVVAISEGVKQQLVNQFGLDENNVHTIYNFFNADLVRERAACIENNNIDSEFYNKKLIVNIGRLVEQKNQKRLIYQFSNLHKKNKDVRLLIIGSGPMQVELEELIEELQLQDVVKICSYCKNPFYLLKQAKMFVLSSDYEGWGNVLLEAMSLGVPVISVDCPAGPREIICGNSNYSEIIKEWSIYDRGILTTCSDTEDMGETTYMSQAMQYFLENNSCTERVRQAELDYIRGYSNDKLLDEWLCLINSTIVNNVKYEENIETEGDKIVVYGAGEYGEKTVKQLQKEGKDVFAVVVSKLRNNPKEVLGIPVYDITFLKRYSDNIIVYIGVSYIYANDVYKNIRNCGLKDDRIKLLQLIPNQ